MAAKPARIKSHRTVSKAFRKSTLRAHWGGPVLRWALCMSSWVRRMASEIFLPGRKADCDGPMTSASAALSLITMTLEIHLYRTLQHDIGRKSFMQEGFSTLGTSAIRVAFTHRGKQLAVKKYLTAARKSGPIMLQQCLKK